MNKVQQEMTEERSHDSCHLCAEKGSLISQTLCHKCLTKVLLKHLPRLKRALELKHGAVLDSWLAEGKLVQSSWYVSDDLQVSNERVKDILRETVRESIAREEIALRLPKDENWKPINIDSLVNHVYEQCVDRLQQFIAGIIVRAVRSAPTEKSEQELVHIVAGKRRVKHRYVRERAVEVLTLSKATPFPLPAIALIEIRYQADNGEELYTELIDGKLSSVWDEVRETLPEEISKLISTEDKF